MTNVDAHADANAYTYIHVGIRIDAYAYMCGCADFSGGRSHVRSIVFFKKLWISSRILSVRKARVMGGQLHRRRRSLVLFRVASVDDPRAIMCTSWAGVILAVGLQTRVYHPLRAIMR